MEVLGEDREPREQRVADQRQQHGLAEGQDESAQRQRDECQRHRPVGVALERREALDHSPGRLAVQADRAAPNVEACEPRQDDGEQQPADGCNRRAHRAPGLALRLHQHVRLASGNARVLRLPGANFVPDRLVVERLVELLRRLLPCLVGLLRRHRGRLRRRGTCKADSQRRGEHARRNDHSVMCHGEVQEPMRRYSFWFCVRLRMSRSHWSLLPLNGAAM